MIHLIKKCIKYELFLNYCLKFIFYKFRLLFYGFFIWVYKNTFFLDLKIFQSTSYDRFEFKEPSRDQKQLFPKFKSPTLQDHY